MGKIVGTCPVGCGPRIEPDRGQEGESRNGLTIGQEVVIENDDFFSGWGGHVRAFENQLVAVDLDLPPKGHRPNGQWFHFNKVRPV